MTQNTPTYNQLVANLVGYHRKEKGLAIFKDVLYFFMAALPAFFLFALFEAVFALNSTGRLILLALLVVTMLVLAFVYLGRALRSLILFYKPDLAIVAKKVGGYYKDVDDRLLNALQLIQYYERDRDRYSLDLVEASLARVSDVLSREDFRTQVDTTPITRSGRYLGVVVLLVAVPALLFSSFFATGFTRLVHPTQNFEQLEAIRFAVTPGDIQVIKGQDVPVRVWTSDSAATSLDLYIESESAENNVTLSRANTDSFSYTIPAVRDTLQYFVSIGEQNSPIFRIYPVERPLLRTLQASVTPPKYSKIEPYFLDENIGDISALKGSAVKLSGLANKALESGQILFSDSLKKPLDIQGRNISTGFRIDKDDSYRFQLIDEIGYENVSPISYEISVIPDNHPVVQIVAPGRDIDLGDDMTIPLAIEAEDDFGISKMLLAFQLIPGGEGEIDSAGFAFTPIKGFSAGESQLRVLLNWDLSGFDMFPTDVLVYYVEAFDNDDVTGPKSSKSQMYRARFPSLYEMYEETAAEQDDATDTFEQALQKTRDLRQKLDQLSLEMQRTTEMDWQKKQEIEEALEQQRQIEKQLETATEQLDEMIEKIEKNNLFTQETMEKFQEIQQLYQDIMTPELQDAMQKMADAMQNLDEKMVRQAMEDMKLNAEEYNQTLDRTISLLKKLKAEQKLDQALNMAEDLAQRQSDITESAKKQSGDQQRLAKEQERIKDDANALSDVLKELQDDAQEVPSMPSEQINEAATEMQRQNLEQNLESLQEMLSQNQMADVPPKSSQAQQSFEKMAESLDMAKQMMSGQMQRQAMQAMRKSSRDLLQLSKQQEQLMQQTQRLSRNSSAYPEVAEEQQEMASALERVVDEMSNAMKENFGIDPRVSQSLGQAMANMEQALSHMESRNANNASKNQGQSMAELNAAVRQLQQSMQNMQGEGSGGGMSYQQFMQQMQQMADAQGQINQHTQGMNPNGQLSLGQQAAMARLAAEQRQVRKSMEQLAKEASGMSEVLGSLDKVADDMKKVEEDFANKNITRDTINRQQRILSRMLDAQKSVHQREFSRERKAETGKNYVTTSPDALPDDLGERKNQLEQDLLRAKKEGYTRDYLRIIEEYFKALTENETSEN